MKLVRLMGLMGAMALAFTPAALSAPSGGGRQYYSGWSKPAGRSYYYRTYYYKPTPTYSGYKHHYVVYYPTRPKYVYYYNPYKKQYWGRCPSQSAGKEQYQLLADKDRKASLDDIAESAFPEAGKMPRIPEAEDDARVDVPPDDLPGDDNLPKADK